MNWKLFKNILTWIAAFALIAATLMGASADSPKYLEQYNLWLDGNKAFVNDSNVYFEAPFVSGSSSDVNVLFQSKQFSGNINFLIGVDSAVSAPKSFRLLRNVSSVNEQLFYCADENTVDYTTNPKRAWCLDVNGSVLWNTSFTAGDLLSRTVSLETTSYKSQYVSIAQYFNHYKHTFLNKTDWYVATDLPVQAGKLYDAKMYFDTPIIASAKYDICIYPSSYGFSKTSIVNAYSNNHLYCLDPFINGTQYEVGNVTNSSNYWSADINSTASDASLIENNKLLQLTKTHTINISHVVAYWTMDENSGTLRDITGNGHDIIAHANSYNSTAKINTSQSWFSGLNAVGYAPQHGDLELANSSYTLSAWVNFNQLNGFRVFTNDDGTVAWAGYGYYLSSGTLRANHGTGAGRTPSTNWNTGFTPLADTWYHIATVYDDDTKIRQLFVNGAHYANQTEQAGTSPKAANNNFTINARADFLDQKGDNSIDELMILNTTLSYDDIAFLYASSSPDYGQRYPFNDFDTTKNLYQSNPLSIGVNVTKLTATWLDYEPTGSVSINATCDADNTSSFVALTSGVEATCPVIGDKLLYKVGLCGNSSDSCIVDNLVISFSNASTATNSAPTITTINLIDDLGNIEDVDNVSGEATDDLYFSFVNVSDADGDNITLTFRFQYYDYPMTKWSNLITPVVYSQANSSFNTSVFQVDYYGTDFRYYITVTDGTDSTDYIDNVTINNIAPVFDTFWTVPSTCQAGAGCVLYFNMTEDACNLDIDDIGVSGFGASGGALGGFFPTLGKISNPNNDTALDDTIFDLVNENANETCTLKLNSFTPAVGGQHTFLLNYTDSLDFHDSLYGAFSVDAAVSSGGGGGGGGGGGSSAVVRSCSIEVKQPGNGYVNIPVCKEGTSIDKIDLVLFNPSTENSEYSFELSGLSCDPVPAASVGGREEFAFSLVDCECPPDGVSVNASLIVYDSAVASCKEVIPVRLRGSGLSGIQLLFIAGLGVIFLALLFTFGIVVVKKS